MSDIQAGDIVVCIDFNPPRTTRFGIYLQLPVPRQTYRVLATGISADTKWVRVSGVEPFPFDGHHHRFFRKIDAADEQFSDLIRKCRPVARPVETALDRLAARLGHAPISPDVAAGLNSLSASDAAYGRMIEATIARDDEAYEAAKAEFWGGAA